ncbi:conjugative transposon TraN protein [Spirosoma oryzae]|uniref:Conjugative transposon TraN protein n=1 Tax=Spirosoma oryzae TaxID=1469603 RepID=A0A2T0S3D2_9BACT|nr:conjugative transposon protein TraN [Spirosoma oryzae]PRY27823.1 conjugative transposon TraN protein [Spirosoma oryzae]
MEKAFATAVALSLLGSTLTKAQVVPTADSSVHMPPPVVVKMAPEIPINDNSVIGSYYIELPFNKTVSIIFDSPVRSVDLGSRDIIADRATEVENVLKVKATRLGFNETNFSVITADGKFYSFVANYNESPGVLALNLAGSKVGNSETISLQARNKQINSNNLRDGIIQFAGVKATQSEVVYNCNEIMKKKRNVRHLGVEANKMEVAVKSVFIKDNVLYYKIALENKSNITYDVDYVRFFVVDKTTPRRTSTQEIELLPFYIYNEAIRSIAGKRVVERVYAFQKFTIPDNKRLKIMAGEINGGRSLSFIIRNSDIMNADKLN